jgi:hypothetical protein
MRDDIVFKSQKHNQEITRTPPFHFTSAACLLSLLLAPEPEIKSTHAPSLKEIQPQQQQQQQERRRRKRRRRKGSQ